MTALVFTIITVTVTLQAKLLFATRSPTQSERSRAVQHLRPGSDVRVISFGHRATRRKDRVHAAKHPRTGDRIVNRTSRVAIVLGCAVRAARADVGVSVGASAGVAIGDRVDPYAGASVELATPTSPLTLEPGFEMIFDRDESLYRFTARVLYEIPTGTIVHPYGGLGISIAAFALNMPSSGSSTDDNGNRSGLDLVAGVRVALPWVTPYLQVARTIGELDPVVIGAGATFSLRERRGTASVPPPPRFAITAYVDSEVAGDAQSGRLGVGISLAASLAAHLGVELDAELHGHFFRDRDVAGLVPEGVDLNTEAAIVSSSVIVPWCVQDASFGTWCPYASAGVGAIHAWFDGTAHAAGTSGIAKTQTNPVVAGGLGVMHAFTRHVGLRVDARYFHAFVDESSRDGGYFKDFGFLRISAGVAAGF